MYFPREIESDIEAFLNSPQAIVIRGPRQSGKTTLLKHYQEVLGGTYISFDDQNMRRGFEENPIEFVESFEKPLFLDESQYISDPSLFKRAYDETSSKMFISGSGSFEVKNTLGREMVGRLAYFDLLPLSLREFAWWKGEKMRRMMEHDLSAAVDVLLGKSKDAIFTDALEKVASEYMRFGGYPAVALAKNEKEKIMMLKSLSQTYIERDVGFFLGVKFLGKFRTFMQMLALSNQLNVSSISSDVGISQQTALNYLEVLERTYVISLLRPVPLSRASLRKRPKAYFLDPGLRNATISDFRPPHLRQDKGEVMECVVMRHLFGMSVGYWQDKSGREIDFIVRAGDKRIPIEVKSKKKPGKQFFRTAKEAGIGIIISNELKRDGEIVEVPLSLSPSLGIFFSLLESGKASL